MADQPPTNNEPNDLTPDQPGAPNPVPLGGNVLDLQIEDELKDSYLTYAMSTIMDRALPDVRDGLKPSQRRILYAMHRLNLKPNRKHLKSAKIAGDTSGDFHPHGESVVYPTLVGMAQDWKMQVPLVNPQGNFGSIDGDPPAAMRYTEARMSQAAVDMLEDIALDTVDYQPNFDERLLEPTVLPGKFPNLLINGGIGIAVGMATSLLPHNPTEIFNAIEAVLENPDLSLAELNEIVPGPDFPTGGIIAGKRGILEGYSTGRGRVAVRGKVHVEDRGKAGSGLQQLVIDEIPYQLIQSTLVERIVNAVKEERIKDITDVRNESGRGARTRIVCEIRRGADPAVVENQLYQFTPLQSTLSLMNIALVNHQPRTMSLKQLIQHHIDHRVEVIERRTRHLLHEAKKKAHVLEGLIYAVCDIDEVIKLIRSSATRDEAINKLSERRFRIPPDHPFAPQIPERLMRTASQDDGVRLTRVQAEAIGAMRLIQLVSLEIEKLTADYTQIVAEIEDYEDILANPERVRQIIRDDIAEMRPRYHRERKTSIEESAADIDIEALIQEHHTAVTITTQGYVKRVPLDTYRTQARGGRGIIGSQAKDDDVVKHLFVASTHDDLLCFTDTGRVFKVKVYEIPEMNRTARGRSIVNIIDLKEGERCVNYTPIADFSRGEDALTFVTAKGRIKRTFLSAYRNVNRSGLIAVNLNEGDELVNVAVTSGNDHVLLVTASGMAIRFEESQARPMGRSSAGVKAIDLAPGDAVVDMVRVSLTDHDDPTSCAIPDLDLLTVTENGYGKRTHVTEYLVASEDEQGNAVYRTQSRAGKGRKDIKTTARNGRVAAAKGVTDDHDVVFITRNGMIVRTRADQISRIGRNTAGVRLVNLKDADKVIAAAITERDADPDPPTQDQPAAE